MYPFFFDPESWWIDVVINDEAYKTTGTSLGDEAIMGKMEGCMEERKLSD